jgi:hypothetical protein
MCGEEDFAALLGSAYFASLHDVGESQMRHSFLKTLRFSTMLFLIVVMPFRAAAQQWERILIPVLVRNFQGAFGSQWLSELRLHNKSTKDIEALYARCEISIPCSESFTIPAGTTIQDPIPYTYDGGPVGWMLYVPVTDADALEYSLRLYDSAHADVSAGTEIPVVREGRLRFGRTSLILPRFNPAFRETLRVYQVDRENPVPFSIRFWDDSSEQLLLSLELEAFGTGSATLPLQPGQIEIPGLRERFPELRSVPALRIEVEPLDNGLRYWTFVSVTNNVNQQVTTVSPQ